MSFIRYALRIRFEKEDEALAAMSNEHKKYADKLSVQFTNAVLDGRTVGEMKELIIRSFVISRIADADNHIPVATQDSRLHIGDKLLITGPTTGAVFTTLEEARVDLKPVQTVKKGQHFSMKADKIRPSDKLYKLVSVEEL